jgi:hypothetical protein
MNQPIQDHSKLTWLIEISSSQQAAYPASLLLVTMLVSAQIGAQLHIVSREIDITLYSLLHLRPVCFPAVVGIIKY